jgi:hypothetical protein
MGYRENLLQHLSRYKSDVLRVTADGIWRKNGRSYPHILPEESKELNIIRGIRDQFWADPQIGGHGKLHSDFHHLNSSQAMCFNFFYPFLGVRDASPDALLELLGHPGAAVESWEFEHVADTKERTNFDFYIELRGGPELLFEAKLSESGFGSASPNDAREAKLETMYAPSLRDKVRPEYLEPERFFRYYQLLRNISYVRSDGSAVLYLVAPKANPSTTEEVELLDHMLLPECRQYVRALWLEEAVAALESLDDEFLVGHFKEFGEKYVTV